MKTCTKCKVDKSITEFYHDYIGKSKDGLDYYCKYCRTGSAIKSQLSNKKRKCSVTDCDKSHYAKSYCRPHYARLLRHGSLEAMVDPIGKQSGRERNLRLKYLMTLETFNKMAANGCEICGDKPERSLHVDHDHKCCKGQRTCGKCVRGILCNGCNKAVEKYETNIMRLDNPKLELIKQYLERYNG